MNTRELELHAELLETKYKKAGTADLRKLRPSIQELIRALQAERHPIPRPLERLRCKLADEDVEDMFDNMPI